MSGIYIPKMEMPKSCGECRFYGEYCYAKGDENKYSNLPCPLVPVPEHGDLIDKRGVDVLSWNEKDEGDFKDGVLFVLDKLDELPVIIPAEGEDYEVPTKDGVL